jgi:hypothetical protein
MARQETEKVCMGFMHKLSATGARSAAKKMPQSDGTMEWQLQLHNSPVVRRVTREGKECFAFCLWGWPSPITLDRINGVTQIAFGRKMFSKKKGRVYFGDTVLREVDPNETIYIPVDFKIGDHHARTIGA